VHPFIAHAPGELVSAFVVPLLSLVHLFTIDWRLTLITLIPVAHVPLMMTPARLREEKQFDAAMGQIANSAVEFVQGISVVKAFGGSGRAHRRFRTATQEICKERPRSARRRRPVTEPGRSGPAPAVPRWQRRCSSPRRRSCPARTRRGRPGRQ
jgi:ATP-binding cassette subfamily B protein